MNFSRTFPTMMIVQGFSNATTILFFLVKRVSSPAVPLENHHHDLRR
jgi:hypothetical protein